MVGNEGMVGVSLALGMQTSLVRAVVQATGNAWRMQDSTIFCNVDLFSAEHRIDSRSQAAFLCKLEK